MSEEKIIAVLEPELTWWEYYEIHSDQITDITGYLYYDKIKGAQITKFNDEVPDEHDIGVLYGSGMYKLIVRYKYDGKSDTKTDRFSMSSHYDDLAVSEPSFEKVPESNGSMAAEIVGALRAIISETTTQLTAIASPFVPVILEKLGSTSPAPFADIHEEMYRSQMRISENQAKSMAKINNEFLKTTLDGLGTNLVSGNNGYEDDEEEEESGAMTKLFIMARPLLEGVMPQIMSGAGGTLIETVRNNSLFQQVVNSEEAMAEIQAWVLNKYGFETVSKLMELLK